MSMSNVIRITLNYLKAFFTESLALIFLFITLPIDLTRREIPSQQIIGKVPILLVHGYMHNSSAWLYLRKRLLKAGFGPIYTINLGCPLQSIEKYAERVKEKAQIIARQTGNKNLILIGHSMGGLVSSYYATTLAPENTVKGIITMGSPLQGTKLSVMAYGRCIEQMRYRSQFVKDLNHKMEDAEDLRFVHLWSATDLIIRPARSAQLRSPNAINEEFEGLGHVSFLYTPSVADRVIKYVATFSQRS